MSFKPLKDQSYYFVAKHSGKVLGFKKEQGPPYKVRQMDFDPNNEFQKFRFESFEPDSDLEDNIIMCPADRHNIYSNAGYRLGVSALSNDDNVDIVMRTNGIEDLLSFFDIRIHPAGEGYYRIQIIHNGKFLDVQNAATGNDAAVVQHRLMNGDNQLFSLLPAIDKPDMSKESFAKASTIVRDGALGLLGAAESLGPTKGALKFIVGYFWKENDDLSDLWDQMKVYVDKRIRELIDEARLESVRGKLVGFMKVIQEIMESEEAGSKGSQLQDLLNTLDVMAEEYIDHDRGKIFPYVIALGTIAITLKHALLVNYEYFYGHKPSPEALRDRLKKLNSAVERYIGVAEKTRDDLLSQRASSFTAMPAVIAKLYFDTYTGWKLAWKSENGDYSKSDQLFDQYKKRVLAQYATEVDEYMMMAKVFKYFKPKMSDRAGLTADEIIKIYADDYAAKADAFSKRALLSEVKVQTGIFGGTKATKKFAAGNGKLTGITFYMPLPTVLGGIEVYYDKKSSGANGQSGKSETYHLDDDDYIVSVTGFGTERIEGLWFQTRKGNTFGTGRTGTSYFSADISDGLKPKLTGISGACNPDIFTGGIEQLSFEWTYIDY
jgi:jacalin-like lectin domain-containing protein/ricin-type beta-trefoil lectin protein